MALDFELKLIMPNENAAIFCRSTLEATRYLIKQKLPDIAVELSNTLCGEPLPLNEELIDSVYQQAFYVELAPECVWEIVELLLIISQADNNSQTPGLLVLSKSLYKDWLELAQTLDVLQK